MYNAQWSVQIKDHPFYQIKMILKAVGLYDRYMTKVFNGYLEYL